MLRYDVLAPASHLEAGRRVGCPSPGTPGPSWATQWHRLRARGTRCPDLSGQKGGEATGPNPTDRGRAGSKRHVITDANGIPLAVRVTAANVADSRMLEDMVDAVPPIRQIVGRPRKRPHKLHADKGYDYARCRRALRKRRIGDRIARKGIESSEQLGRRRWVVERTIARFSRFRRLTVRYDRRANIHDAFTTLAAALITLRFCQRWFC